MCQSCPANQKSEPEIQAVTAYCNLCNKEIAGKHITRGPNVHVCVDCAHKIAKAVLQNEISVVKHVAGVLDELADSTSEVAPDEVASTLEQTADVLKNLF